MATDRIRQVKEWWGKHANKQPVWRVDELPEKHFKEILLSLKLAYDIRRDIIVLGKPDTELSVLLHSYFWEILSCILKPYTPYALTGMAAIHFYLGNESIPNKIDIITKHSSTQIDLHKISLLSLEKNPGFFEQSTRGGYLKEIKTSRNYSLSIESAESLLIKLRPAYLRDYPQVISGFLKGVDFKVEVLNELLLQKSKPITYSRLAILFEQIGKNDLVTAFKNILKSTTHYAIAGKSQIIKYQLPPTIAAPRKISDPPYVTRFRDQLRIYADAVETYFKGLSFPTWNLKNITKNIEATKKYDTYHSSTIEGYRVTQEEIQLLIEGREMISSGKSREEIEKKMALKGYLESHQFVLNQIENNYKKNTPLTELIIREIYAHLFAPSVEAGLIKKDQLIQYRNDAVYIRNSRYVPPNHAKMDELMRCLVEEVNEMKNHVTQAILAHYGFVTVHPYFDGNGRVARLLMNYLLCRAGIPWVTIRIEDRDNYFNALEIAQCDENIEPFIKFMKNYLNF